jgi:DnaK suppressor protein
MSVYGSNHLKDSEIEELKSKLKNDLERIVSGFKEKKDEYREINKETKDEVDSANDNILVSTSFRFTNRENFYLKKIKKALKKIEEGEYGLCEDCGVEITYQRLKARPTSELCINCKEESEREENQNFFLRGSKSIGKKIDLVTNI